MRRIYYNKLIRDAIPEKIAASGAACEVRELSEEEFGQELLKKVIEESGPVARSRSREEFLHNLPDLLVVIEELKSHLAISDAEVEKAIGENRARKGGFEKKLFLKWSSDNGYQSDESVQGISK